ncbi:sterile alpha motif domain-containing protein 1-like [Paramacrobiotus metropolitanus]|uniref:sterile alpha motif domain-containing protein 1-like n=1 Tax=Paramacrobiotus metropolitanus TaxID=2943436 RepID=UPI002445724E|nr:sterile alpha motif domain-containing protein 1-like [Paramacrobiotus metropolitanus]XP_055329792.1 sterile alpha motif domain-containing protein 1-like [Paramacrobiotus metropolitanus]XP_055329793.1 sterile alpha motif domain-containing protein 1-like [Paramacrobiotus metropolitanus]XP_055329794.1 sterile alpha motif domain-containing protein 1-like [Paramacrobiotus metropolitanus]
MAKPKKPSDSGCLPAAALSQRSAIWAAVPPSPAPVMATPPPRIRLIGMIPKGPCKGPAMARILRNGRAKQPRPPTLPGGHDPPFPRLDGAAQEIPVSVGNSRKPPAKKKRKRSQPMKDSSSAAKRPRTRPPVPKAVAIMAMTLPAKSTSNAESRAANASLSPEDSEKPVSEEEDGNNESTQDLERGAGVESASASMKMATSPEDTNRQVVHTDRAPENVCDHGNDHGNTPVSGSGTPPPAASSIVNEYITANAEPVAPTSPRGVDIVAATQGSSLAGLGVAGGAVGSGRLPAEPVQPATDAFPFGIVIHGLYSDDGLAKRVLAFFSARGTVVRFRPISLRCREDQRRSGKYKTLYNQRVFVVMREPFDYKAAGDEFKATKGERVDWKRAHDPHSDRERNRPSGAQQPFILSKRRQRGIKYLAAKFQRRATAYPPVVAEHRPPPMPPVLPPPPPVCSPPAPMQQQFKTPSAFPFRPPAHGPPVAMQEPYHMPPYCQPLPHPPPPRPFLPPPPQYTAYGPRVSEISVHVRYRYY